MIKTITGLFKDGDKEDYYQFQVNVPSENFDVIAAIKKAAHEFCLTKTGRKIYDINHAFTWVDFASHVPNAICCKYGFTKVSTEDNEIKVNLDENLIGDLNQNCEAREMRSRAEVNQIREKYPIGTRIRLIEMKDRWPVPAGTLGTVERIDDDGQLHMIWETGSSLALDPDVDQFETLGSIVKIKGDVLKSDADLIVHQVNCKGVMGAGVAKQVRDQFPLVFQCYKELCYLRRKDTSTLLGVCQYVTENSKTICNAFGQDGFNRSGCNTDYDALRKCFRDIAAKYAEKKIALPYLIGCGLAGGDWNIVYKMIVEELVDTGHCNVVLCEF